MYNIYPNLKEQKSNGLSCKLDSVLVYFSLKFENVLNELKSFLPFEKTDKKEEANLIFTKEKNLKEEEYTIELKESSIEIKASDRSGFYYAVKTLKQIVSKRSLPLELEGMFIHDYPDMKLRGYMYDISRNKVPNMDTVKYLIDIMSDLKMNHLELYVEGFSFEYKSFPMYLEKNSYIKVSEYKKIEKYCDEHCIDLVPNENGFGHMTEWLKKDEFKDLAELPGGMELWGAHRPPSTLDPNDERSVELVAKMYDDMLPISKSKYFNMNFDEPFELGKGKSKEMVEARSEEEVYIDFVNKVYPHIKKHGKQPMIWGDVLVRHGASLERMPKDMIYLDWGYEANYPFDKHLKMLKDANVPFASAPGSTVWCGWLGRLYDWTENISNAIWNTFKLGGLGVLLTDWGDFGHIQGFAPSLPPLVYTALLSYTCKAGTLKQVRDYLNRFIFKDKNNLFADVLMDSSSYYQYEKIYRGNGTVAYATFSYMNLALGYDNPIEKYREYMKYNSYDYNNFIVLNDYLNLKKKQVNLCEVDKLWKDEILHTLNLIQALSYVNIAFSHDNDKVDICAMLEKGRKGINKSMKDLKKIWMARNKSSYLYRTLREFENALKFIDMCLEDFKGGKHEEENTDI